MSILAPSPPAAPTAPTAPTAPAMTAMAAVPTAPHARRRPFGATPGWWRASSRDALVVSLLLVCGLWAYPHGVADLGGGAAAALMSLGRLTGLVASDLLLVQVLLMARVPLVERAWGQDELARLHRLVGFSSFNLMLAHIVLIGVGYAGSDGRGYAGLLGELWDMTWNLSGMLLAVAGTLCLVLVVVTSVRAARRRLRYESWHLLHLYAYLGVGLALPHQLWTGKEFLSSPVATLYWWSLWAAAAAAVLYWRVGIPVYRTLAHGLTVTGVVRESQDVVSVWMKGRDLDRLPVAAGQFFTWRFLTGSGWMRGHPYSLSAAPTRRTLRITVKDLGDGSRSLADLRPGTRVVIEGPYGRLHGGVRTRPKVTLIASGVGITPLRGLLEELPQQPGDVTLIYRASTEQDLLFTAELDAIAEARGARVIYAPGHRVPGRASWLPDTAAHLSDVDALQNLVPDIADQDVYICGAAAWMDAAKDAALAAGVPPGRIHRERFSW